MARNRLPRRVNSGGQPGYVKLAEELRAQWKARQPVDDSAPSDNNDTNDNDKPARDRGKSRRQR